MKQVDTSKWAIREGKAIAENEAGGIRIGDTVFAVFGEDGKWIATGTSPSGAIDRAIKVAICKEARS